MAPPANPDTSTAARLAFAIGIDRAAVVERNSFRSVVVIYPTEDAAPDVVLTQPLESFAGAAILSIDSNPLTQPSLGRVLLPENRVMCHGSGPHRPGSPAETSRSER